jgi:hypothetical protein
MTKLYLHAGTHKTGTTAIQAFAAAHRAELLRQGLLYPSAAPLIYRIKRVQAHHWFAHALAEKSRVLRKIEDVQSYTEKWLKKAHKHDADVLISIEALYRHILGGGSYEIKRTRYLERVADTLRNFDVTAVLVFRRPDVYMRSFYSHRVMHARRALPDFQNFVRKIPKGLRYHKNASLFREAFSEVLCLTYEDLNGRGKFFSNFFTTMGVDASDLNGVGVVRKSLSAPETLVKNFANQYLETRRNSKAFLRWMRRPDVAGRIREYYGDGQYDLWPSHAARREFLDSRQEDIEKLRQDFFPGRDRLFPPLTEGDTAPPVPPLPEELKQMVLEYFGRKTE